MSFEPRDYLHPILVEADYLLAARCDLTFEAFSANENLQRACVRSLEIIGEEAKKIPDDCRVEHPEVERRAMAGMRDCLIHDYFAIDFQIVWKVVQNRISKLRQEISLTPGPDARGGLRGVEKSGGRQLHVAGFLTPFRSRT